uniref:Uncharacterized protein n=1 Tax=Anopheles albimanus TaxID=7167 RepID=A0A182FGL4_ANOAL
MCSRWLVLVVGVCCVGVLRALPYLRTHGVTELAKTVCFISASNEQFDYDSLRTGLCSHILLIDLMGVGKDGELALLRASSRALSRFDELRRRFAKCGDEAQFLISIGGVSQRSSHFSKALQTSDSRYALCDELVSFIIKHELDGIDVAWFYPGQYGGVPCDRDNLVMFLEELYLRAKACGTSLSITVGVDPKDIELSYDVPRINEVVDFVNLLTGDYHDPKAPSHVSPLYGLTRKDPLNVHFSVTSYIEAGLNPRKIVILNSCYAYLYVSRIDRGNPACRARLRAVMRLSYLTAKEMLCRESFHTSWDDTRLVPYGTLTKRTTKKWITYSDAESARRKSEYVMHQQLGGIGLFGIDQDDFAGRAGCGQYPILKAMVYTLHPELVCAECSRSDEAVEPIVCPCVYNGTNANYAPASRAHPMNSEIPSDYIGASNDAVKAGIQEHNNGHFLAPTIDPNNLELSDDTLGARLSHNIGHTLNTAIQNTAASRTLANVNHAVNDYLKENINPTVDHSHGFVANHVNGINREIEQSNIRNIPKETVILEHIQQHSNNNAPLVASESQGAVEPFIRLRRTDPKPDTEQDAIAVPATGTTANAAMDEAAQQPAIAKPNAIVRTPEVLSPAELSKTAAPQPPAQDEVSHDDSLSVRTDPPPEVLITPRTQYIRTAKKSHSKRSKSARSSKGAKRSPSASALTVAPPSANTPVPLGVTEQNGIASSAMPITTKPTAASPSETNASKDTVASSAEPQAQSTVTASLSTIKAPDETRDVAYILRDTVASEPPNSASEASVPTVNSTVSIGA